MEVVVTMLLLLSHKDVFPQRPGRTVKMTFFLFFTSHKKITNHLVKNITQCMFFNIKNQRLTALRCSGGNESYMVGKESRIT